ncbi:MAG TPA: hypothetical protein VL563_00055 [Gemmatimonadales bacterium]|nr:hypothetical protein [Gemmatimonadales bacterium]
MPHRLTDTRPATRLEITFDGILDFPTSRWMVPRDPPEVPRPE